VLGIVGALGLALYAHDVANSMEQARAGASEFASQAALRHLTFVAAATEYEQRVRRDGMHVFASLPPAHVPGRRPDGLPGQPNPAENGSGPDRPGPPGAAPGAPTGSAPGAPPGSAPGGPPGGGPDGSPGSAADGPPGGGPGVAGGPPAFSPGPPSFRRPRVRDVVFDGTLLHGVDSGGEFKNSFGFAVAALFGARFAPGGGVSFLGGYLNAGPDAAAFQNITLGILGAIFGCAVAVGIIAGLLGRYITQQAIQPLIDVTESLQRFAARDFRAQPIAVAGHSDFDVLAHAYNSASAQVAAAFAERDLAEAQMRQFVADAGHELRTPLTIVLGYIDLLRRRLGDDDDRSRLIFNSIGSEGRRMRTLVDNLVLLAKLEGDDVRPIEPFALADLIREITDVRRGLDPAVRFELDFRVSATAIADRAEMHEALANLIDNAIKYAPGSPVRITLDSAREGTVDIAVSDDGPGIDERDRAIIFERFFRGAARGEVEGSGLGLAIAKRAVERAGGSIALDATVARGTRFVITLRAERVAKDVPIRVS
jgi:signal transduction histidine kinase